MTRRGRYIGALCAVAALAACRPDEAAREAPPRRTPQRIVSLAPSLTELLFTLGAGGRVVGVTRFCDRPEEAKRITPVGDSKQASLEAIVTLRPDLILINSKAVKESLRPLGDRFPILLVETETITQMLESVELVGSAISETRRARALRRDLESTIRNARRDSVGRSRGRVMVVLQRDPYFVAGPGSYVDELLDILGWENAASGIKSRWPCISAEALVNCSPDVILDMGFGAAHHGDRSREVREYWKRFETLPAVGSGRVHALDSSVVVRPGPALREALGALRSVLPQ